MCHFKSSNHLAEQRDGYCLTFNCLFYMCMSLFVCVETPANSGANKIIKPLGGLGCCLPYGGDSSAVCCWSHFVWEFCVGVLFCDVCL